MLTLSVTHVRYDDQAMTSPSRVLRCTFPFPDHEPPVQASEPCVGCPNADRSVLDLHDSIPRDEANLLEAIGSFVDWVMEADEYWRSEVTRYAAELYTRPDHSGTCVPKTVLFAIYKGIQFDSMSDGPPLSDRGIAAVRGEPVERWPDGQTASGATWSEMFRNYAKHYETK